MIVICELLVNDEKTGSVRGALMSLNMLIENAGGRNYTPVEYRTWLRDVGFSHCRIVRFKSPGADGAVIASNPKEPGPYAATGEAARAREAADPALRASRLRAREGR